MYAEWAIGDQLNSRPCLFDVVLVREEHYLNMAGGWRRGGRICKERPGHSTFLVDCKQLKRRPLNSEHVLPWGQAIDSTAPSACRG